MQLLLSLSIKTDRSYLPVLGRIPSSRLGPARKKNMPSSVQGEVVTHMPNICWPGYRHWGTEGFYFRRVLWEYGVDLAASRQFPEFSSKESSKEFLIPLKRLRKHVQTPHTYITHVGSTPRAERATSGLRPTSPFLSLPFANVPRGEGKG